LNPHVRGNNMPQGAYSLQVPQGGGDGFGARYARLLAQWEAEQPQLKTRQVSTEKKTAYIVQTGDSLGRIAVRFGVSVADLARWNGLDYRKPIYPGQRLIIYR